MKLATNNQNSGIGYMVSGSVTKDGSVWTQIFTTDKTGLSGVIGLEDTDVGSVKTFNTKVSGYLREKFTQAIYTGINNVDLGLLRAGDLNNDGTVNNIDLSLMYDQWYGNGLADYNGDGMVNSADHWILTKNFFTVDD